jgi:P4 family phage/plasmid primase-like protien
MSLSKRDLESLSKSWISPEYAERAHLYRVDDIEGAALVGRAGAHGYAGTVYPNCWPGEQYRRSVQVRRDVPDVEIKNGRPRERGKYMNPPGEMNRAYITPGVDAALLSDTNADAVFVEGPKKTIATQRLLDHSGLRAVAVGLSGVFNYRGSIGKMPDANGQRVTVKGVIPDIERITWTGRKVTILFDANASSNPMVAAARNGLAVELASRGAKVFIADLPEGQGVNGIDDYLAINGPEAGIKVLESARPFDPKEQLSRLDNTDYGNERAFEILFGEEYRYDCTGKRWLRWTGVRWEPDSLNSIDRRMLAVATERLDAAGLLTDPDDRKRATAAALKLRNIRVRQSALESATSNERFARRAEDFDRDDLLFACANGVIELQTGTFRPGRREDMLTKASPVIFDRLARCDRWLRFLSDVFAGSAAMIDFIQRAVGLSLTGLTREEVFLILYGKGRNGKGTLLRVLLALFGDYAVNTDFATLIADKGANKGPRNDLAAMAGRRFVTAQESREGAQLDEALIKALTGGDLITARFLHREFFTFKPTWKIWVATNHRPEIRGTDDGIWSRPKLVPFNVSFEGREDRGLKEALLEARELSGILNWALEGCRAYLEDGLRYPDEVTSATAEYKADSDVLGRFLTECCHSGQGSVQARRLYQVFVRWATETGEQSMTETAFGRRMVERGIPRRKGNQGAMYHDIGLSASAPESAYVQ